MQFNALYSFARSNTQKLINKAFIKEYKIDNILIDSGAFTLRNAKCKENHITIENYMKYCHHLETLKKDGIAINYFHFDYLNNRDPDYIKKSNKNFDIMKAEGLSPIPCFRKNDSFKTIDKWLETEPLISIGGLVRIPNNIKFNFLKKLKDRYGENCNRFHLLGYGDFNMLEKISPYSSDSCNFANVHIYFYKKRNQTYINFLHSVIPSNIYNELYKIYDKNNIPSSNKIRGVEKKRLQGSFKTFYILLRMSLLKSTKCYFILCSKADTTLFKELVTFFNSIPKKQIYEVTQSIKSSIFWEKYTQ